VKCLDFTLEKYGELCQAIVSAGYETKTVRDYLLSTPSRGSRTVILRHDVDRKPEKALNMAVLEKELGLFATYYFRYTRQVFREEIIKKIVSLNHEIGYHYETLSKARGDYHKALELFQEELHALRDIADISTICMHGRPLSAWDNRWLWREYDFRRFQILGEAYLSVDYSRVTYFTDTGRSWNADKANIRDRVSTSAQSSVKSTDDLMELIRSKCLTKVCIQTHPERWDCKFSGWLLQFVKDNISNLAKPMIFRLIVAGRRKHNRVESGGHGVSNIIA
jgi:hypothetical protein